MESTTDFRKPSALHFNPLFWPMKTVRKMQGKQNMCKENKTNPKLSSEQIKSPLDK